MPAAVIIDSVEVDTGAASATVAALASGRRQGAVSLRPRRRHFSTAASAATLLAFGVVAPAGGAGAGDAALRRQPGVQVSEPEDFVNVFIGTEGGSRGGNHHSVGNVLPLATMPWGMNAWAPQTTNEQTSWWFDANDDTFRGVRCTHQPSPWIGDYAWFVLRPHLGGISNDEWIGFTSYHISTAVRPWLIDISAGPHGVQLQLAPTDHGAVARVRFPQSVPPADRKLCVWVPVGKVKDEDEKNAKSIGKPSGTCMSPEPGVIALESRRHSGGIPNQDINLFNFHVRLEAEGLNVRELTEQAPCFSEDTQWTPMNMPGQERSQEPDIQACQRRCASVGGCAHFTWWSDGGCHLQDNKAKSSKGPGLVAGPPRCQTPPMNRQCCFMLGSESAVQVLIGTSFISAEQAKRALDEEVSGSSIDQIAEMGKSRWHDELSKIEVQDAGPPTPTTFRRLEIFYSSLYRALLFPRRLDENTASGVQHWSPYSGRVQDGPGVTDNGFWDTFRTVYPMLSLGYPEQLGLIVEGWLNAYRAGGWLPKWASPGYRGSMVGTFADVVLSDAIMKNIKGFDYEVALEALLKDANEQNPDPKDSSRGKFGLGQYKEKGYIPTDAGIAEACSRTLDFAFADAATASAARKLGKPDEAEELLDRSKRALTSMFDKSNKLMGHRNAAGVFKDEPAWRWGDCFTEGSAWHHSFPPFDLPKLAELHGGHQNLIAKLKELFTTPSKFEAGSYKAEIHEMREMRMLGLGQYAHNNQPVHHLPFLFALLGDRNTTAHLVRRILTSAYSPEGFAGDEDNGEMGSWYVLGALGLYAAAPGVTEDYVLASTPLFRRVRLAELGLTIESPSATEAMPVVSEVRWDSRPWPSVTVPYSTLANGGTLRFLAPGDSLDSDDDAVGDVDGGAGRGGGRGGSEGFAELPPRPRGRGGQYPATGGAVAGAASLVGSAKLREEPFAEGGGGQRGGAGGEASVMTSSKYQSDGLRGAQMVHKLEERFKDAGGAIRGAVQRSRDAVQRRVRSGAGGEGQPQHATMEDEMFGAGGVPQPEAASEISILPLIVCLIGILALAGFLVTRSRKKTPSRKSR